MSARDHVVTMSMGLAALLVFLLPTAIAAGAAHLLGAADRNLYAYALLGWIAPIAAGFIYFLGSALRR